MLQIITGMYFKEAQVRETSQRRILYTNIDFQDRHRIELPIGHMTPDTDGWATVRTVMVHFVERLELLLPDGREDFLVSTGAHAIADDLAVALSFFLDATFTTSYRRAEELVQAPSGSHHHPRPADVLPRTFTPGRVITDSEVGGFESFLSELLSLNRRAYEKALRAMRRIVLAGQRAAEDPTLSYTDYVAALESLSAGVEVPPIDWERFDSRKRKILDPVLDSLDPDSARETRSAILESERAGIKHRYVEFVVQHIGPSFFREEVTAVKSPLRHEFLRRVVAAAYDARSKNLHELRDLEMGTWLLVGGAHTVTLPGNKMMLTHAGLSSVSRHVVRKYIRRSSKELDRDFNWRENLPNLIWAELAPEMYLGRPDSINASNAALRAGQLFGLVIEALSGRQKLAVDMRPALARVEELLATHRTGAVREPLLAIYFIWHQLVPVEAHRPSPEAVMEAARKELQQPSLYAFAAGILLGLQPPWSIDELCELAESRYEDLQKAKSASTFPERLDAALWVLVTQHLGQEGARELALAAISRAIGCAPGHADLIALEQAVASGEDSQFDLHRFVLGDGP